MTKDATEGNDATMDAALLAIREELLRREPIFHRREFGTTRADFERMTDQRFWETGASGRQYSREYVLAELEKRFAGPQIEDVWQTSDFRCMRLSEDTYLVTYTLLQHGHRLTRRATIWGRDAEGWKIRYHQGTVVQGE